MGRQISPTAFARRYQRSLDDAKHKLIQRALEVTVDTSGP